MWTDILKLALANGLWCALFVFLFFYQLRDSKTREEKYVSIIEDLSESFKTVHEIDEKLDNLTEALKKEMERRDAK